MSWFPSYYDVDPGRFDTIDEDPVILEKKRKQREIDQRVKIVDTTVGYNYSLFDQEE